MSFLHANLANVWTGLHASGVGQRPDGALVLARLPQAVGAVGATLTAGAPWSGSAGVAVDSEGTVYVADPRGDHVVRIDACDGASAPLLVPGGSGSGPTQLSGPRGIAVGPGDVLYVVDGGNHRVYVVDLATLTLRAIWGQPDTTVSPAASADPGRFDEPWDVAVDTAGGAVYVIDHGNRRVQKFDATGRVITAFRDAMSAAAPVEPAWITTATIGDSERVLVLDRSAARLSIYTLGGELDAARSAAWATVALNDHAGLAATADAVYVGDRARGRIAVFDPAGVFIGYARGYEGPIAGLTLDGAGRVIVHPGPGAAVVRLDAGAGYVLRGSMRLGPFTAGGDATRWHRFEATSDPLPGGAHVRWFTCTTAPGDPAPAFPAMPSASTDTLAPIGVWRAAADDANDALVLNEPGRDLWIAAILEGDGTVSAAIHQLRLEYEHETWLRHLPVLYARDGAERVFLERSLSLFEAALGDRERRVDDIPRLFDAAAVRDGDAGDGWLTWLSGWLALDLDDSRPEAERRRAVAASFAAYARRGTADGIASLVQLLTGADARVEDAAATATIWSLGADSVLGFSTMLAAGSPHGAVLGTTATLDGSHLTHDHDAAEPIFDALAHQVCVQVRRADIGDARALETVRQVIAAEVPAHVAAHVCVVEPALHVGSQARVGIDAIVGGPAPALVFEDQRRLGVDAVLGDAARARPAVDPSAVPAWLACAATSNGGDVHG